MANFEYREGVIRVSDIDALIEERPSIEVGAFSFELAEGEAGLSVRDFIDFMLEVEGQMHGPFHAEIVHVANQLVGLHLDEKAMGGLIKLCEQAKTDVIGHPVLPSISQVISTIDTAARQIPPEMLVDDSAFETSIESPRSTALELAGHIGGRLSVGLLRDILDPKPTAKPLSETSLLLVFRYLAEQEATGCLTFLYEGYEKKVWYEKGIILRVDVTPPKEDELLGQILLKAKWITNQQLADTLRWGRDAGTTLGATIIKTGILEEKKLVRALVHQNYRRIRNIFEWIGAKFYFEEGQQTEGHKTPLIVSRLVAELALDVLRQTTLANLNLLNRIHADSYPLLSLNLSPDRFKQLLPEEKTRRVCEQIFNGKTRLRDAIKASVLGHQQTERIVLYLMAAKALDLNIEPITTSLTPRQMVLERLRILEVQDPFQRLGFGYREHPDNLDRHLNQRLKTFDKSTLLYRASPQSAEKAQALLKEAKQILSVRPSRVKARIKALGSHSLPFLAEIVEDERDFARLFGDRLRELKLDDIYKELSS